MSWHLVEKALEEAGKHSTWLGKIWILSLFFFRILIITRIGDTVYHDEQAAFRCNNRQPGCENVCFSKYSPLSFIRFCAFQIIMVAIPMVIYILYSAHIVATSNKVNPGGTQNSIFKLKKDRRAIKLKSDNKFEKSKPLCAKTDVEIGRQVYYASKSGNKKKKEEENRNEQNQNQKNRRHSSGTGTMEKLSSPTFEIRKRHNGNGQNQTQNPPVSIFKNADPPPYTRNTLQITARGLFKFATIVYCLREE